MTNQERLFSKVYAQELFRLAVEDFRTGQFLATNPSIRKENTLFNLEQAVEKALKAVLCHLERPIPLVHDIYAVLSKLPQDDLPSFGYDLNDLTPYATIRRYEEGKAILSAGDVTFALDAARSTLTWCAEKIGASFKDA